MRRILIVGAALVACLSTPASAAHWNVDYAKSRLGFTVQWSNEPFVAVFRNWKADIDFDAADLSHARAVVNVDLGSEASDAADNDEGLKGAEGFQTSQFPNAQFETTRFTHTGGNEYVASAKLTIHGVTRPLTLPFTLVINGDRAYMTAKPQVVRTDFGLGQGEWADENVIGHLVTVNIDLTATKAR